jgi:hypothetical protein
MLIKFGACPSEAGLAGTTPQQVKQSVDGALIILLSAGAGPLVEAFGGLGALAEAGAADGSPVTPRVIRAGDLKLSGVPEGATGVPVQTGKGLEYAIPRGTPEIDPRVTGIRIMDPVTSGKYQYPNGYAVYMNYRGQTVNPLTGQTISNSDPYAHIGLP